MHNSQSKFKRKSTKLKVVKCTIQFLSVAPDLKIVRAIIQKAQKTVICAISNGALYCCQVAVHIPLHLIPLFRRHNKHFDNLVDSKKSIPLRRYLFLQKSGSLPIIAQLLATVLGSIGGEIIWKLMQKYYK